MLWFRLLLLLEILIIDVFKVVLIYFLVGIMDRDDLFGVKFWDLY